MNNKTKKLGCYLLLLMPLFAVGQNDKHKAITTLNRLGLKVDSNLHFTYSQANQLMSAWDSLYDLGKKIQITNTLSDAVWEQLILQEIKWAKLKKQTKLNVQLHYYLAHIYHSQKLFSKSIPIQSSIIQSSQYLSKKQLQKTYAKLEKAYVQKNDLRKALSIRKQRLEKGFTDNAYELYQDFELHELALKDFLLYRQNKFSKAIDQYKFYKTLGVLYFETGQLDSAKLNFNFGLELCEYNLKYPDPKTPKNIHLTSKSSFLGYLGRCYMEEGDYKKAIRFLLLDITQSEDDVNNKIFKMIHLTNCYIQLKNIQTSKKYLREIDQLSKHKEDKRMHIRISELKSKYYQLSHQFDSAYYFANQFIVLKNVQSETIRKNQALLLLSNIEADTRKKDLIITRANLDKERSEKKAQIAFLWASIVVAIMACISLIILFINNIQKTRSKLIIEKKNEENELLLKELHHRVKNNLQVIYSLINLQKRRLETPELNQSLSMVQNRIKTMSLVHQNLHENESFKVVNLHNYIKTITEYLKSLYFNEEKEIVMQLDIDTAIELPMDKSITIGLLINEIISNSLKYAFKGQASGIISIEAHPIQDGLQMKIHDNGIGFISEDIQTKSLGMYLIKNLVKQIQGRYEVENFKGTTYTIYFKA